MTFKELQEAFKSWCLDLTQEVEAFFVGFDFYMEQMMP